MIYSGLDLPFDMKIAVFVVGCPGGIGKLDYIAQKKSGKIDVNPIFTLLLLTCAIPTSIEELQLQSKYDLQISASASINSPFPMYFTSIKLVGIFPRF